MIREVQSMLKQNLPPLESQVDYAIKHRVVDKSRLDHLLSDLLDFTQIEEGVSVFKRLCQYCYPLYPELTARYILFYRDHYDPDYDSDLNDVDDKEEGAI